MLSDGNADSKTKTITRLWAEQKEFVGANLQICTNIKYYKTKSI